MSLPSIFISYSHRDEREKDRLVRQLSVLRSAGLVDLWSDDRIRGGDRWAEEIDQALVEASVAVLLVSANYLTSPFILEKEVPRIFERHAAAGLQVFPVVARPCAWRNVEWLTKLNVRPKNGDPVWRSSGRYVDAELAALTDEVYEIVKSKEPAAPEPAAAARPAKAERGMQPDGRATALAVNAIESQGAKLQARGTPLSLDDIADVLRTAIYHGVPIFNAGGADQCATIYRAATRSLIKRLAAAGCAMTPSRDPFRSELDMLPGALANVQNTGHYHACLAAQAELAALDAGPSFGGLTDAWRARFVFDAIRDMAEVIQRISARLDSDRISGASPATMLRELLETTLREGVRLYEQGVRNIEENEALRRYLMKEFSWIRVSSAVLYHGSFEAALLVRMYDLSFEPASGFEPADFESFCRVVAKLSMDVRDPGWEGSHRVAWELRAALERLLAGTH
jgi:TIR domain